MKHRDIFEWEDGWVSGRDDFIDSFVLEEIHEVVDGLDLSAETIERLHKTIDKVRLHFNGFLKDGEEKEEPVIHCKECTHWEPKEKHGYWFRDDRCVLLDKTRHAEDFCSMCERREK